MTDALDKRTAFFTVECGLSYETAMQRSEAELIPLWLNEYSKV